MNRTWTNYCNIFIAKKEDFIKWGEFVFGVFLESDKKYNLKTDDDIKNLIIKRAGKKVKNSYDYQTRLEAFLMEKVGNMFYIHYFYFFSIISKSSFLFNWLLLSYNIL